MSDAAEHTSTPLPGTTPEAGADAVTTPAPQPLAERVENRAQRPSSDAFRAFMASDWAPASDELPGPDASAPHAARRRAAVSARFPGERIVVPAGRLKVRSNDTDYRFRAHSAFAHLTGLGVDHEPDAVLVLEPVDPGTGDDGSGHTATLYFRPLAGRDSEQFYADPRSGEFWIGPRPTLAQLRARTGLRTAGLDELEAAVTKDLAATAVRLLQGSDQDIDLAVAAARQEAGVDAEAAQAADTELTEHLSELRLVKDSWEIERMRASVASTIAGFEDVVRALPRAVGHERGERVVEGAFFARARLEGNDLGYDTIAASGNNATILHWITNTGAVRPGELLLLDAGVEDESLYTADLTRTLPVSGRFSPVQRRVYQAVLDAADAAFAIVRPGIRFRDVHAEAMRVLVDRLSAWGLLPVSAEQALAEDGQHHRRWMPHGTSHHLGLDVHDCAQAKRELYLDGVLEPGMVFTIEPGLYFKAEDLAVPEEYRGIGVRIEDDILVTEDGAENLSAALPRIPEDVEAWMARLQA
ncbi:aminopeptidase P family protein [Micrococcus sp.]|uniref:aminopeptidase P family protein n=1 Tax=Micrococcus sp. TaxID=1271 RepID=UPI002A90BECF|nr:aminopeptidase P family protein [Micrococcus sp.]MDY6054573.1 aminopeptidase P family protein [Micrococcus sp.]